MNRRGENPPRSEATTSIRGASVSVQHRASNAVRIFGYDVFISFALGPAPRGTLSYASDLARRLRERDFTVFFSEDEAPPGDHLDDTLRRALLHSKALVVIVNKETIDEPRWVRIEVEEFSRRHPDRPVIPISVGGALENPSLTGVDEWLGFRDRIWIDESDEAVLAGIASDTVVDRLALAPGRARSNVRWRWLVRTIGVILFCLTIAAVWAALVANKQAARARMAERDALRKLYIAQIGRAYDAWADNNPTLTADLLGSLVPAAGKEDLRSFDWYYLWNVTHSDLATINEVEAIAAVAVSPDDHTVAISTNDGGVKLYNRSSRLVQQLPTPSSHDSFDLLAFRKTDTLVGVNSHGVIRVWELKDAVTFSDRLVPMSGLRSRAALSRDARKLVFLDPVGNVIVHDVDGGVADNQLETRPKNVQALAIRPEGQVAVVTGSGEILVTEPDRPENLVMLSRERGSLTSVAFSPTGDQVAAGNHSGKVKVWDIHARKEINTLSTAEDNIDIASLTFSTDGRLLGAGTQDPFNYHSGKSGLVVVWDLESGTRRIYQGHLSRVSSVAFAPKSKVLVSGSADNTAKIWDVSTGQTPLVLTKPERRRLFTVAVSTDGSIVVTGSKGASSGSPGDVDVWDVRSHKRLRLLRGHTSDVNTVVLDSSGTLYSGSSDGTVRLWDVNSDTPRAILETDHKFPVYAIAIDPSRRQIAVAGGTYQSGSLVQIWDLKTLRPTALLHGLTQPVRAIAVSKSGHWLAVGAGSENPTSSHTFELRRLPLAEDVGAFADFSVAIRTLAFSPSGGLLAVGWADRDKAGDISIWDLETFRETGRLRGHQEMVTSLAFTPDGHALISSSGAGLTHYAGEIKVWDLLSLAERVTIARLAKPVWSIALSADGQTLAAVTGDQQVSIWQAPMGIRDSP